MTQLPLRDLSLTDWSAAATIAATFLGVVEVARAVAGGMRRRQETNAKISALAYRLRRQLLSWLDHPGRSGGLRGWIEDTPMYGDHFDRAEALMVELAAQVGGTSWRRARAIQEAFVRFLAGTQRLNRFANEWHPTAETLVLVMQLEAGAVKDLRECVTLLESKAIAPALLREERMLEAVRTAQADRLLSRFAGTDVDE